jgi:hypothetical protein
MSESMDTVDANAGLPDRNIASCGDITCELLVNPIPRPKPEPFVVTMKPVKQQVVLVDNRKPNSLAILKKTQEILRSRGVDVYEKIRRKPSAGTVMEQSMLDELVEQGGLILAGISD